MKKEQYTPMQLAAKMWIEESARHMVSYPSELGDIMGGAVHSKKPAAQILSELLADKWLMNYFGVTNKLLWEKMIKSAGRDALLLDAAVASHKNPSSRMKKQRMAGLLFQKPTGRPNKNYEAFAYYDKNNIFTTEIRDNTYKHIFGYSDVVAVKTGGSPVESQDFAIAHSVTKGNYHTNKPVAPNPKSTKHRRKSKKHKDDPTSFFAGILIFGGVALLAFDLFGPKTTKPLAPETIIAQK